MRHLLLAAVALSQVACSLQGSGSQPDASAARTSTASCNLPVVSWYQPGPVGNVVLPPGGVQARFVSYPGGAISSKPADEFTFVEDGLGFRSSAKPVLRGTGPVGYYDAAFKRFVPVPRAQVSPDGRRYVYMDYTKGGLYLYGQLHVVEVQAGRDRTLDLPAAAYLIFDFTADGIYFTYGPYGQSAGLLVLDPDTAAIRTVFADGYVLAVADGVAWLAVNERDLHPTSPLPGGEGNAKFPVLNVLLRRDLKTNQIEEWFRRLLTGWGFEMIGVYSGAPVVLLYLGDSSTTDTAAYEIWLLSNPATPEKVAAGVTANLQSNPWYRTARVETAPSNNGLGMSDTYGIWLGGDAIYLYKHGQGLTKVAAFPGFPANICS